MAFDEIILNSFSLTQMYITQSQKVSEISPYRLNNEVLGHFDGSLILSEDQFVFFTVITRGDRLLCAPDLY